MFTSHIHSQFASAPKANQIAEYNVCIDAFEQRPIIDRKECVYRIVNLATHESNRHRIAIESHARNINAPLPPKNIRSRLPVDRV